MSPIWRSIGRNRFWVALFVFVLGLRFFSGFLPQGHGDALLYHLLGPRLWMKAGMVKLDQQLPNALLASSWEYLYLWPQLIIGNTADVLSLAWAQIFSQWIHLSWGWGALAWALYLILVQAGYSKSAARLAALGALFVPSLQWTGGLAKNDCGIAAWCLTAYYFWRVPRSEGRPAWDILAGMFAGAAVSGKISAVLFLFPAFFVELVLLALSSSWRIWLPRFLALTAGAVLTALPIYLRNFVYTQNPFFPMFATHFPSPWVSQSWADHFSAVQPTDGLALVPLLVLRIQQLFAEGAGMILSLVVLPILFVIRPRAEIWQRSAPFLFVVYLGLILFVVAFKQDAELRYLGALLVLTQAMGLALTLDFVDTVWPKARVATLLGLVIVSVALSKLPTHILWKYPKEAAGAPHVLTHTAGDAKAWLRQHIAPADQLVVMGDNEMYYLSGLNVTVLTERPDLDAATYGKKDFSSFVSALCEVGRASYLFEARLENSLEKRYARDLSSAILYQGRSSRVYDLNKLEKIGGKSSYCPVPGLLRNEG